MIRTISGHNQAIPLGTELYGDLFIGGDDAAELLEMVWDTFGTSFAGLDFHSHFSNQAEALYDFWWRKLFRRPPQFKSFTVAHLMAVIRQGCWFEPNGSV